MKNIFLLLLMIGISPAFAQNPQVKTANGLLEGVTEASGIRSYKGIPFAQPPVGDLRWKAPQPLQNWMGVRKADKFGPQAMQRFIFSDMLFRSNGKSEDCLYLNVWTPAKKGNEKLPVLVYFYGGGFVAGDGSELRYDGESMAQKGIVSITVNYRLGVFGFMAHPELTAESPNHASGNYGLLDQHAALEWVKKNIAAFGGDPSKVTIAGESAGSMSVSAQMASPLSKGLFSGAICQSGAILGNLTPTPHEQAEQMGVKFATTTGATTLADLRKIPADKLLELSGNARFAHIIDGYFLTEKPEATFAAGRQMNVPLLAGWTSAEVGYQGVLGMHPPTLAIYKDAIQTLYPDNAAKILEAYPAATDSEVKQVATQLASDRFIAYSTWKIVDMHSKSGKKNVYRYLFSQKRPDTTLIGAPHASDIEYSLGNLPLIKAFKWTPADYKASQITQDYFANFIKTGNPNGKGLPVWNEVKSGKPPVQVLAAETVAKPDDTAKRYALMDELTVKK
ncbi:carboxylesterase family protein [Mucilaginibacter sp. UR6-1]|uniref:carboxylesterase/lipase family protein n=1 Tax=Mucilaginibacter sp. UR6-1 TaxID=1435643 RepID=UPI001E567850|nr:carboxylesterase family protein [Mucilaginibacter sp. UR6-1]MCC8409999.1 carboxylesterase family protein [Mucilaginibacter sp. UR6-1]